MPLPFLAEVIFKGLPFGLKYWDVVRVVGCLALIVVVKLYMGGRHNLSERVMHSKVVMITGGTSGIGAAIAYDLAKRGAQLILLVHQDPTDFFIVEYIDELRASTKNDLIYAEKVDLASTHDIRKFATKWIDNAPPRRLDMIILCGATLTPPGSAMKLTREGLEETWMVNYLANFHLLSILSPAIRNQPPDRDVRVLFAVCPAYIASPALATGEEALDVKQWSPAIAYARSKLAFIVFGHAFQKHLDAFKRPDGSPNNARVIFVDPGYTRTPGMRRYLSRGTLWGLGVYLAFWHQSWLWLKSSDQGAQSFLYAAQEESLGRGRGGRFIKECMELDFARKDIKDENVAKSLWQSSEKLIERVEREEAVKRALAKEGATTATNKDEKRPTSTGNGTSNGASMTGRLQEIVEEVGGSGIDAQPRPKVRSKKSKA